MISIKFEEREKIGLQYALETLHGCSPFGQERVRRLRFYAPEERAELEEELYNVEQAANCLLYTSAQGTGGVLRFQRNVPHGELVQRIGTEEHLAGTVSYTHLANASRSTDFRERQRTNRCEFSCAFLLHKIKLMVGQRLGVPRRGHPASAGFV